MGGCSLSPTDINSEECVPLSLRRLEVVDLVVDLQTADAALEAGIGVQEVVRVPEGPSPTQKDGLGERYPREETLTKKSGNIFCWFTFCT